MESNTDITEWRMEVERVLPSLKVHIKSDNKVSVTLIYQLFCLEVLKLTKFYYQMILSSNLNLL